MRQDFEISNDEKNMFWYKATENGKKFIIKKVKTKKLKKKTTNSKFQNPIWLHI